MMAVDPKDVIEFHRDTHGYPVDWAPGFRHGNLVGGSSLSGATNHKLGQIAANNSAKFGPYEPGVYEFTFFDGTDLAFGSSPNVYVRPADASFTPGATPSDGEFLFPASRLGVFRIHIRNTEPYLVVWNPASIGLDVFVRRLV